VIEALYNLLFIHEAHDILEVHTGSITLVLTAGWATTTIKILMFQSLPWFVTKSSLDLLPVI